MAALSNLFELHLRELELDCVKTGTTTITTTTKTFIEKVVGNNSVFYKSINVCNFRKVIQELWKMPGLFSFSLLKEDQSRVQKEKLLSQISLDDFKFIKNVSDLTVYFQKLSHSDDTYM